MPVLPPQPPSSSSCLLAAAASAIILHSFLAFQGHYLGTTLGCWCGTVGDSRKWAQSSRGGETIHGHGLVRESNGSIAGSCQKQFPGCGTMYLVSNSFFQEHAYSTVFNSNYKLGLTIFCSLFFWKSIYLNVIHILDLSLFRKIRFCKLLWAKAMCKTLCE